MQSGASGHRAAGLWLATALPLTAERAVSAIGFKRGNEGVQTREEQWSLIEKMNAFRKATTLRNEHYNREKLLLIADEESILDELSPPSRPAENEIRFVFGFLDAPSEVEPAL